MKVMHTGVKRLDGRQRSLDMESIINYYLDKSVDRRTLDCAEFHSHGDLFGYFLPEWQREFCWTEDQQIRFIESCYLGYSLGSIVVNGGEKAWFTKYDKLLLDGQQRLTTIKNYLDNKFPVFGCYFEEVWNGQAIYPEGWYTWQHPGESKKQLTPRNHLFQISIPMIEISSVDDDELKEIYIRMNFGGTSHTESDLKKVK